MNDWNVAMQTISRTYNTCNQILGVASHRPEKIVISTKYRYIFYIGLYDDATGTHYVKLLMSSQNLLHECRINLVTN